MNKSVVPERALITGATGFVGSHLVKRLAADGWDVHIIVRPNNKAPLIQGKVDHVTQHIHDGSSENMRTIVFDSKPDVVFHLASHFLSQHTTADIEPLIRSNILFATQLVDAMIAHNVCHLINTGSSWQHYEDADYNPVCLYAATKQAFEDILTFYINSSALKVITLKLFDTYGPNDPRPKLFNLLQKATQKETYIAMSPGKQLLDLVYIDDVVECFVMAAQQLYNPMTAKHQCYAVSSGTPIVLRDLVALYSSLVGKKLHVQWGGRPYRNREVMRPWNSGVVLPGWNPKVSIENGINKIKDLIEQHNGFSHK